MKTTNEVRSWAWVFVLVLGALFVFVYQAARAQGPASRVTCLWKTCGTDGDAALCGTTESGSTDEMFLAERLHRGPGKIFVRECVYLGDRPRGLTP